MEQTATGSSKLPLPYYSKLQELLTSDRSTRRSDLAETSNAASSYGNYCAPDGQSDREKKMKLKSDAANGGDVNQGPVSFKVDPIVLKKYYPSPVQSAECEEFLVSLSEDETQSVGKFQTSVGCSPFKAGEFFNIKPKDDLEYMGAQIDKLLSMPSPKSSWKAPRRLRKFQCTEIDCNKSYSTEDDLKSHMLSHSLGASAKPFGCDICDKKFKWSASLKVHKQRVHDEMRSLGADDGSESSQEESSPPSSQDERPRGDEKAKEDVATKTIPTISSMPQQERSQSFELVVSKVLSTGLVSSNVTNHVEKSTPPRRQCSIKDSPTMKTTVSKKDGKSSNKAKMKVVKSPKKKAATPVEEETDDTPLTPASSGRTSLRRNIQRPKWLSDADLVTDYEFPRGTNAMRTGITNSASSPPRPSASPTTAINGNQRPSRTVSSDSTNDSNPTSTPKSHKIDKSKPCPPSSRDRKRKKERNKTEPKKNKIVKKIEAKEGKIERKTKNKDKHMPTNKRNDQVENNVSPAKQLSTKILTLRLEDLAKESSSEKPPVEKNVRKRPGSASSSPTLRAQDMRKSKRKRSLDVEEQNEQSNETDCATDPSENVLMGEASELNNSIISTVSDNQNEHLEENEKSTCSNGGVETVNNLVISSNALDDKTMPQQIEPIITDKEVGIKSADTTGNCDDPSKSTEPILVESFSFSQLSAEPTAPSDPAPAFSNGFELNGSIDSSCSRKLSVAEEIREILQDFENERIARERKNQMETECSHDDGIFSECLLNTTTPCETKTINTEASPSTTDVGPFSNHDTNTISFAEIAMNSAEAEIISDANEENKVEENKTNSESEDRTDSLVIVRTVGGNDEEMPILRPETSSSAAGSRSDSFAERMQSIDEDVSSSSNHSILPEAPILSKEGTGTGATTFANGITNIVQDCKTDSAESTAVDNQEEEKIPLIDGEESDGLNSQLRRDRSDSLSVRSFGSGSQSEKIKTLEDTASKDKCSLSNHDGLVDSDSTNDSLMSEFSELAAQISENTDGVKFKEECLRFLTTKVSANSMWSIRKELKRLKKDKNYFKFGKLSPLAAGLMHDIFCQSLE